MLSRSETHSWGSAGFGDNYGGRFRWPKYKPRTTLSTRHLSGTEPTPASSTNDAEVTSIQSPILTIADTSTTRQRSS